MIIELIRRTPLKHLRQSSLSCPTGPIHAVRCGLRLRRSADVQNFKKHATTSLEIIRQLRKALATLCIDYIDADFYILDEFQRFRDLINEESDSESAKIAKLIFKKPNTKVLFLSATPFKAFTGESDLEGGEDITKSSAPFSPSCWKTTGRYWRNTNRTVRHFSSNSLTSSR